MAQCVDKCLIFSLTPGSAQLLRVEVRSATWTCIRGCQRTWPARAPLQHPSALNPCLSTAEARVGAWCIWGLWLHLSYWGNQDNAENKHMLGQKCDDGKYNLRWFKPQGEWGPCFLRAVQLKGRDERASEGKALHTQTDLHRSSFFKSGWLVTATGEHWGSTYVCLL